MRKFYQWVVWFCAGVVVSVVLVGNLSAPAASPTTTPPNLTAPVSEPGATLRQQASIFTTPDSEPAAPVPDREPPAPIPNPEPPAQDNRPAFDVLRQTPDLDTIPSRDLPRQSTDPADQIAPPGLLVRPGDAPISPFFAFRMQKELDNLVGRFESALFAANAIDQPVEVQLPAGDDAIATGEDDTNDKSIEAELAAYPVLVEARELNQEWADLMERQAFREARSRWLGVRQGLWDEFPLDRPFAQPEIRAMWLDRGSIVRAGSRDGLARLFDNMQASGINTVFFETINAGFPIYRSRVAPQQNPSTEGWDPLADAVALAHARNMDLHAWMWTFAAGNLRHNSIILRTENYLGPSLGANPDWLAYDQDGNPIPLGQTKPFYDPANPEVRAYLLSLVEEIITHYDVDGLQLDYIRYPFQDPSAGRSYGYGVAARREFRRLSGIDPIRLSPVIDPWLPRADRERRRSLWEEWNTFRIEQVTSFVAETSELVRRLRPEITLSAAVFAMPERERLQKIQQDWNTWAEEGLVDWIVLMSYAEDANRFAELITPWVLEQDYGSTLVIPGMRLLNMPIPVMIDQLQTLRDLPAAGYALFATDNLDTRIQTVLNNTQGTHTDGIPQKQPYATAAARYKALQQEWNWLLANGQMALQPRLANRWITEINAVGASLDSLANGSSTDLETVRSQVEALKKNLRAGLSLTTATSTDYRYATWNHRLETIDRLLVYGAARGGR
jgi:uncharacterized lipoprotein YddW (UPF0748 family)